MSTSTPGSDRESETAASTAPQLVDRGCPFCGAPPGEFCHTPTGKPRSDHAAREYEEVECECHSQQPELARTPTAVLDACVDEWVRNG